MGIVKGAPKKYKLVIDNDETNLPASDVLANDVDLCLFTDTSKNIARFGTTNIPVEHEPDSGEFIITVDVETTALLTVGETAWLEGFILPSKESIRVELGIVEDNRAND